MDLGRSLAGCQVPAQCTVCVAASYLALETPMTWKDWSPLPDLFGGAHQLHLAAKSIYFHDVTQDPPSQKLRSFGAGEGLAYFLSCVPGLKRVSFEPRDSLERSIAANRGVRIFSDVHTLAASLAFDDMMCSVYVEGTTVVVEYL